jgi:branched-chain amino acid transport system permease protein
MDLIYHLLTMSGIYVILTLSLNLTVGYAGLFNLGQGAFFGIGAYTAALLSIKLGFPFLIEIPTTALVTGLLGMIIGVPALRLSGDYLALATFGLGVIVYTILNNWISFTGGPMGIPGIPRPTIFTLSFNSSASYMLLVTVFALLIIVFMNRLTRSAFGRVLLAIREDETATLAIGKNTSKFKILAFLVCAFIAGIAGSLYAHYISFVDPSSFTTAESFLIFSMVVFGGMESIPGSILGATTLILFPESLRLLGIPTFYAAQIRKMLYGLLLVIIILKRPQGLWGKYPF